MNKAKLLFFCLLSMKGISQPASTDRPQTPKPPFPYQTDSVEYDNADRSVRLGATFSYPRGKGPFTTVILVTGSGQQDRDETIFNHRPFAVIADYLTRQGYAVLRVDDRGMGKSHGSLKDVTSLDFAEDVMTSIHYLLTRAEVDKNKIGILGHSEGGLIAPIVYSKWPKLAFIVSLAGPGLAGAEILLRQQTDPLKGLVSQAAFDAFYDLTKRTLSVIHDQPSAPDSIILGQVKTIYNHWKAGLPDSVLVPLHADAATAEQYAKQVKTELMPWLRYFISTDPSIYWQQVRCPVLALNGEKDIQVYPHENTSAIRTALESGGNRRFTIRILPGLNHLFQSCSTCDFAEYAKLQETFSPGVLRTIARWLNKTIR